MPSSAAVNLAKAADLDWKARISLQLSNQLLKTQPIHSIGCGWVIAEVGTDHDRFVLTTVAGEVMKFSPTEFTTMCR